MRRGADRPEERRPVRDQIERAERKARVRCPRCGHEHEARATIVPHTYDPRDLAYPGDDW